MVQICNGSITAFGARIINSLGYSGLESVALLIPGGFVTCVTIYLFTWPVSRTHNKRTYVSRSRPCFLLALNLINCKSCCACLVSRCASEPSQSGLRLGIPPSAR